MSDEYANVPYCATNQMANAYTQIKIPSSISVNNEELITPDIYTTLFNTLIDMHNFGDYDTRERIPNIDGQLTFKKQQDYIPVSYYNDIINRLQSRYSTIGNIPSNIQAKEKVVLGSYFQEILNILKNYKISETRYYKQYRGCCDCDCDCNCNCDCDCNCNCDCDCDCNCDSLCSKPRDYCGLP